MQLSTEKLRHSAFNSNQNANLMELAVSGIWKVAILSKSALPFFPKGNSSDPGSSEAPYL